MSRPRPLEPTLAADRFRPLGHELMTLLESLSPEDWMRSTVAPAWRVRDIAAHLLDSAYRRLSAERDGWLPAPSRPLAGYPDLVSFLNELNRIWVEASERLSPRVLVDCLRQAEERIADHLESLDPWGPAIFPVSWAGEEESRCWFDVARELTERWHHQQQIRLAVGADALTDPFFSEPVFDAFLRVLPHGYREFEAGEGTRVALSIEGALPYGYTLRREKSGWRLWKGAAEGAEASIRIGEEPAWRLLSKGLPPAKAREAAEIEGDERLAGGFFSVLAVMA